MKTKKSYQYAQFRASDEFAACRRLTRTVGRNQRVISVTKLFAVKDSYVFGAYIETTHETK